MASEFEEALDEYAAMRGPYLTPIYTVDQAEQARARVVALYEAAVKDAERGRWFVKNLQARSLHMDGTAEYIMQPEGRNFRRAASREEAVDRAIAEEKAWRESPGNPYRESSP